MSNASILCMFIIVVGGGVDVRCAPALAVPVIADLIEAGGAYVVGLGSDQQMGDDFMVTRCDNTLVLYAARAVALHDEWQGFSLRAVAHDQGGLAAAALQRMGVQAAHRAGAQYVPV